MTIPLTGSGSLFQRAGAIWGGVADILALEGATATTRVLSGASWATREATLQTDYAAGTADVELLAGDNGFGSSATPLFQAVNSWETQMSSLFTALQTIAANTFIKMADRDASGLQSRTISAALQYLINQMTLNSTTVNATTVSVGSQTAVGTPTGTPQIVVSAKDGTGQTLQYSFGETFTFACSADSQTGGQTVGQEYMRITGQTLIGNQLYNPLWPGGSGISTQVAACSSQVNNSGTSPNVLQNSGFETYTNSNNPDNWTIATGTAGTQVVQASGSNAYMGTNSVAFVGDSSTLTAIAQLFNQTPATGVGAGGTSYNPVPQTSYAVNGWLKLSAGSPAAGVLEIALIDGSGTIINDSAGTANSKTVTLSSIGDTAWHNFNAIFRLPAVRPSTVKLRIRLSTALTTGTTVYVDSVAMNPMTQLYKGGPFASIFSGATNLILGDSWTLAYTPTWGVVQQYLERFFGMKALGLTIPAATSSPTVADSVVA